MTVFDALWRLFCLATHTCARERTFIFLYNCHTLFSVSRVKTINKLIVNIQRTAETDWGISNSLATCSLVNAVELVKAP